MRDMYTTWYLEDLLINSEGGSASGGVCCSKYDFMLLEDPLVNPGKEGSASPEDLLVNPEEVIASEDACILLQGGGKVESLVDA
jgi:hypothetical protein